MGRLVVTGLLVLVGFLAANGLIDEPEGVGQLPRMPDGWELTDPYRKLTIAAVEALWKARHREPGSRVSVDGAVDDLTLERPPSITPQQIDAVLAEYGSPATGSGQRVYDLGVEYGIDPAYALAFFIRESSAGTAGVAVRNRSWGNITCGGWPNCPDGRFRRYASWEEGAEDWYRLIRVEYIDKRGHKTVEDVVPVYAPAEDENDVEGYIEAIRSMVSGWRRANQANLAVELAAGEVAGRSAPIPVSDDRGNPFAYNVKGALDANDGALRRVRIEPGQTWSFNETVGDPERVAYTTYAGVPGGGWCDLAARYIQAARPVLPPEAFQFVHHGLQLANVAWEDSVAIWNIGGRRGFEGGRQDLLITNTTDRVMVFEVEDTGSGEVVITSKLLLD